MGNKPMRGGGHPSQPSFIQTQRQKLGDGWLNRVNALFIRKNALKVFKDLAYGSSDIDLDYKEFMNANFVYNLCDAASDNARYNYACYIGLYNSGMAQNDPNLFKIMNEHRELYLLYNSLVSHLNNILQDIATTQGVYVKQYLQMLVADIRWKRNAFCGYFITIQKTTDTQYLRNERRPRNEHCDYKEDQVGFFGKTDGYNN